MKDTYIIVCILEDGFCVDVFETFKMIKHIARRGVKIDYDSISDMLYVQFVAPYAAQWIDSLDDDTTARLNPLTKTVEGLEIWHYIARLEAGKDVMVPVSANDVRVLEAV